MNCTVIKLNLKYDAVLLDFSQRCGMNFLYVIMYRCRKVYIITDFLVFAPRIEHKNSDQFVRQEVKVSYRQEESSYALGVYS